jgi:hypothetical protein
MVHNDSLVQQQQLEEGKNEFEVKGSNLQQDNSRQTRAKVRRGWS